MFEALVTLCIAALCRDVLLPGYEATTQGACEAAISGRDPAPFCAPAGPALDFAEVAPGVFVHQGRVALPDEENRGDVANIGFIIGSRSVVLIDSGGSRAVGEAAWRAIRARTELPVSHVILTHMHPDHVFGATVFAEAGALVVGHAGLARALADRQENYRESLDRLIGPGPAIGTSPPRIDLPVAESASIDAGGRGLDLVAWPPAHTGTDLTVFDRTSGILFAGDLLFDRHAPALDGKLRGWQAVLADLAGQPLAGVVPGHGGPLLGWPEGALPLQHYLDVLARDTRAALDAGQRMGDAVGHIAQSEAEHWDLFDEFNARNATVAFTELEWE